MNVYVPILLVVAIAAGFSFAFVVLSRLLGPSNPTPGKLTSYECGIPSRGTTNLRFYVRFYVVALLFLLFDLETVFLVPWAVSFRSFVERGLGGGMFVAMAVFMGLLVVGLVYEWRKGALEWE
jgi:NADH-quinone oxidoreductase subunit A